MKRIKPMSLWVTFAAFVFFIIFISYTILLVFYYLLYQIRFPVTLQLAFYKPPVFLFILLSIVLATAISFWAGKHVFGPVATISDAMTQVAKGNFNVHLKYSGRVGELREMSSNFRSMVHDLGNIETLRNDFVTSVSHEFKTPLASIEGYATILQNPDLSYAEVQEYAKKISESTKQLTNLCSNILMISNLENKEIVTEKTAYRLDEQIRQSVLILEPLWDVKKINLNIDLDHAIYYGNEEMLMQVWLNMITNAIKFTPKNGDISIELKETSEALIISISDTGAGMTPEVQKHIFDKFYKGDASGFTDGNGLGLSLVKRIIDLCRGEITVHSEPGTGTCFAITLPVMSA